MIKHVCVLVCCACLILYISSVAVRLAPESSPAARGASLPEVFSCLNCHGKNSKFSPDDELLGCDNSSIAAPQHLSYDAACEDMLAYFSVVQVGGSFEERAKSNPQNRLMAGEMLARQYYCFQCHGELGQGGYPNIGALKGYVPGYFGQDFRELTRDGSPDVVKTWIVESTNPELLNRLIEGPVAAFFLENQTIQMPTFNSLSEVELQLLVDYVTTINRLGPMTAATVRKYEAMTREPIASEDSNGDMFTSQISNNRE